MGPNIGDTPVTDPRFGPKNIKDKVTKGTIFRRLDELSRNRDLVRRMVAALQNLPQVSIADLGVEHGYIKDNDEEAGHVRTHWLDSEGWFKDLGPVEPLLRAAMIKAGELVLEHDLPCDAYVVSGHDRLEVAVCKSDRQITLMVLSPVPPIEPTEKGLPDEEDIWMVRGQTEPVITRVRTRL
jgi:hypothetical protein